MRKSVLAFGVNFTKVCLVHSKSADPMGACSINIGQHGSNQAWHFDESAFSTTIMLQKPDKGGLFQLTRPIRETFEITNQVLHETFHFTTSFSPS